MKIATKTPLVIITSFLVLVLVSMTACGVISSWDVATGVIETGKPTTATFWVTVPYNTPQQDTLLLSIEGQEPIEMNKVGGLSWEAEIDVKGGDEIDYKYLRGGEDSFSSQYSVEILVENQKIYDSVSEWSDLPFEPSFSESFVISIYMVDTWGRNYNFNWFENTRRNVASSFRRVGETGVKEVYVNDFFRAVYGEDNRIGSTDYEIEGEIFDNDYRDEVMTLRDLIILAREAKTNSLEISWRSSMHFVDMGKYIGSSNITAEVAEDWEEFGKPKTKEWVEDFLNKWKALMLERADMLNRAKFDIMILTPGGMTPDYYPYEEIANEMWKDIITSVKEEFNGEVGVVVNRYGFLEGICGQEDWSKYDYYQEADIVYYYIYCLLENYKAPENPSLEEMREKFGEYLDDLEERAREESVQLSIMAVFFSYENGINEGLVEFNDIENPDVQALEADWQHQADAYEALFQAAEGRDSIVRIVPCGYWWDGAMNPEDTEVRVDIAPSARNKPAEAVFKKWATALR